MPESFESKILRWKFNFFPAYRATHARLTYMASDFMEVHVRLPLIRQTVNYVNTMFGGSIYSAVDPIYMMMLIKLLGDDYVVWDKAALIKFKKPGRSALTAVFKLDKNELETIRKLLETHHSIDRVYHVEMKNTEGVVCAEIEKTVYVRRKDHGKSVYPVKNPQY